MNRFKENLKIKPIKVNGNKFPDVYNMYDINHNHVGYINSNYEKMQNKYLEGICIFLETENGKIVMEKRGNTILNPYEDDYCSGHVENNETYLQAVYREIKEELGLSENELRDLKQILKPVPLSFDGRKFFIQFFYGKINSKNICIDKKEVESYYEEDFHNAIKKLQQNQTKFKYVGNEKYFDEIIIELQRKRKIYNNSEYKGDYR